MDLPDTRQLRPTFYLSKREEALQKADETTDPFMRKSWLNVAENYGYMVEMVQGTRHQQGVPHFY